MLGMCSNQSITIIIFIFLLKVTTDGKFVFDLDSPHKKPYEILLIGRKNPSITVSCQPEYENNVKSDINEPICKKSCHVIEGTVTIMKSTPNTTVLPRHHSFMCIPSTVHSQKPYVGGMCSHYTNIIFMIIIIFNNINFLDLLKQYIDEPVRGLELFARNLTPGWTSWGNEVRLALKKCIVIIYNNYNFYYIRFLNSKLFHK